MSIFRTIACLIAHAPVAADFVRVEAAEIDEVQLSDKIPGWDDWLHDNSVTAYIAAGNIGRVRAQAWGVSNPFDNFRSLVGAEFRFRFALDPSQLVFPGERHRFSADVRSEGLFLHTAAVPSPGDEREPPARTFSQMNTRLNVFQTQPNGSLLAIAPTVNRQDHFTMLDATDALEEVIDSSFTVSQDFFPSGEDLLVFSVVRSVLAAATGVYSDARIRGSEERVNFRVRVRNPRVHKVLEVGDACFDVLRGTRS